jgi:hypothetical protein
MSMKEARSRECLLPASVLFIRSDGIIFKTTEHFKAVAERNSNSTQML